MTSRIRTRLEKAIAGDHLRSNTPLNPPTDEERNLVKNLRLAQLPIPIIAERLDISESALKRHYRAELDAGGDGANASVAQALFQRATDPTQPGQTQAAIFWLKCRAGWKEEPSSVELTGANGGPLNVAILDVLRATAKLDDDARAIEDTEDTEDQASIAGGDSGAGYLEAASEESFGPGRILADDLRTQRLVPSNGHSPLGGKVPEDGG